MLSLLGIAVAILGVLTVVFGTKKTMTMQGARVSAFQTLTSIGIEGLGIVVLVIGVGLGLRDFC
jgi:hypothetical protein